jgi:hypothetical protein
VPRTSTSAAGRHARRATTTARGRWSIEETLPEGVDVAGAAYRGVGIPACVRSGQGAADRLLEHLGLPVSSPPIA